MLYFVADSYAVAAENTFAGIPHDRYGGIIHRLGLSGIGETNVRQAQAACQFLKAAGLVLFTDGTVPAVGGQQQLQNHLAVMLQAGGIGTDGHFILGRGGTGGN